MQYTAICFALLLAVAAAANSRNMHFGKFAREEEVVMMEANGLSSYGIITDSSTGEAIEGLTIYMFHESSYSSEWWSSSSSSSSSSSAWESSVFWSWSTAADGSYEIRFGEDGGYYIVIFSEGWATWESYVTYSSSYTQEEMDHLFSSFAIRSCEPRISCTRYVTEWKSMPEDIDTKFYDPTGNILVAAWSDAGDNIMTSAAASADVDMTMPIGFESTTAFGLIPGRTYSYFSEDYNAIDGADDATWNGSAMTFLATHWFIFDVVLEAEATGEMSQKFWHAFDVTYAGDAPAGCGDINSLGACSAGDCGGMTSGTCSDVLEAYHTIVNSRASTMAELM